ncbi:MAG TPA: hypothetical protein VK348_12710, partial [Planctomycetota bacterium]|nr:hypothetical protein [Planctomycetota bacterium]
MLERPAARADAATAVRAPSLYLGFALTTCSMLLVQQFLTRVFTIQFNSGLAFLAISTTFLGLGSAGAFVYLAPKWFAPARIPRLLPLLALAYALLLVFGFVVLVALDHGGEAMDPQGALTGQVQRVIRASLLMLPALFTVGLLISLVLRAHVARVNRLYGADLAGGGIGCLLVLPLMDWIGGDHGIFAIGALASAGALLLAHAHARPWARLAGAVLTLALVAAPWLNRNLALVDVRSHRTIMANVDSWVDEDHELARTWNSLSRLGFFPTKDGQTLYVRIDSSCQTTIPAADPARQAAYIASTDFEQLPFALDRHQRYLEIGAGGGRGMVLAHGAGARSVTGVEINPGITAGGRGAFPGFGIGALLAEPQNRYLVEEGRGFARRCGERFDTVTITFIQTGIASSSAAFALSEANLFTVEAFREFLGLLTDDGLFYVYRHGGNEMLRLLAVAEQALQQCGIADLRPHVYVARNAGNQAALLVSKKPFTSDELARLEQRSKQLGIEVLFSPAMAKGELPPNPFPQRVRELRAQGRLHLDEVVRLFKQCTHDPSHASLERTFLDGDHQAFLDDYLVDVRPSTDDRPYYFFYGLNHVRDLPLYFEPAGTGILGGTVVLLFWMAAAFTLLIALLICLPLLLRRQSGAGRGLGLPVISYFSGLGLGYIAVQISFIQRFTLFLGHPVYAIS